MLVTEYPILRQFRFGVLGPYGLAKLPSKANEYSFLSTKPRYVFIEGANSLGLGAALGIDIALGSGVFLALESSPWAGGLTTARKLSSVASSCAR